jgi:hypothetical protein
VGGLSSIASQQSATLKPNGFTGLFVAVPLVAPETFVRTIVAGVKHYAIVKTRSMIIGVAAFCAYSWWRMQMMATLHIKATIVTVTGLWIWLACMMRV